MKYDSIGGVPRNFQKTPPNPITGELIRTHNREGLYEHRNSVIEYVDNVLGLGIISMTIVNNSPLIFLIKMRGGEAFRLSKDELCDLDALHKQLSKYTSLNLFQSISPKRLPDLLYAVFCASNSPKGDGAVAGNIERQDNEMVFNCLSCHNPIPLSVFMQTKACPKCGMMVAPPQPTNPASDSNSGLLKQ